MKLSAPLNLSFLSDLNIPVEFSSPLSNYTTFKLGAAARAIIHCFTPHQLQETVQRLHQNHLDYLLIGGGSNLVVSDQGLDVVVIRYASDTPLIEREGSNVRVAASTALDALALFCVEESLEGLNYTTGIPGTVGGAVIGNAGAWGKQVGDVLVSAEILTLDGVKKEIGPDYFEFRYRHSRLKETGEIIVSALFALAEGDALKLAAERANILKLRHEKHPDLEKFPCAGSFFRNIEPTSKAERRQATGWFLEEAGGKNLKVGGAQIFDKHANIIVKSDGCRAQDVYDLSCTMAGLVKQKFNLDLVREVRFVGSFKTVEKHNEKGFW